MKKKIVQQKNRIMQSKLIKNFLLIFSGEGIGSIFGFLATIFIINTIGSYKHGILVAVQTYTNLFYGLFSFKTFQSLIKFLAKSEKNHDTTMSKIYIKWSVVLDVLCMILTLVIGIILRKPVIKIMGWNNDISKYCIIYLCVYMFNFQGTSIGVLRYFENYHYVVKSNISCSVVQCIGFFVCFILKLDFTAFFVFDCVGNLIKFFLMNYYTVRTLKEHDLLEFYKEKLIRCSDFLKFSFYSNITSTIDLPINQVTSMIINKYLGFEAMSAYNIFGCMGSVINKLGDPISQIIYPEMNQLISKRDVAGAKRLSYRLKMIMLIIFIMGAAFVVTTNPFWLHMFISNPSPYVLPLVLYIAYVCYSNASMGTHNLFMAIGYVKYNIPILIIVNSLYLVLLLYSIQKFGLTGVIVTYIVQAFAVVASKEVIMRKRGYKELM